MLDHLHAGRQCYDTETGGREGAAGLHVPGFREEAGVYRLPVPEHLASAKSERDGARKGSTRCCLRCRRGSVTWWLVQGGVVVEEFAWWTILFSEAGSVESAAIVAVRSGMHLPARSGEIGVSEQTVEDGVEASRESRQGG